MNSQTINKITCGVVLVVFCFFFSCKKEHLPPDSEVTDHQVFITALLGTDSVYFAGGVNSYMGSVSFKDTLTFRMFNFTLKNLQNDSCSYFEISINNYKDVLGIPQSDLDSSIYISMRPFQYPGEILYFIPLGVTVTWVDTAGLKFSSSTVQQSHLFSITAVDDVVFENKNYKEVSVEFECNLDADGSIIHLTNGKATIMFGI